MNKTICAIVSALAIGAVACKERSFGMKVGDKILINSHQELPWGDTYNHKLQLTDTDRNKREYYFENSQLNIEPKLLKVCVYENGFQMCKEAENLSKEEKAEYTTEFRRYVKYK